MILKVKRPRRINCVARMRQMVIVYKIFVIKRKGKRLLRTPCRGGEDNIQMYLK